MMNDEHRRTDPRGHRSTDTAGISPGPQDRKRTSEDWRAWLLGLLLVVLVLSGISAWRSSDAALDAERAAREAGVAVDEVARVERKDRDANRQTAYRLCSRNKNDRAYAHARERGIPIEGLPAPRRMSSQERRIRRDVSRALMDTPLLVILDCDPNTEGMGARPLPISRPPQGCERAEPRGRCATQEAYMYAWAAKKLTRQELGVCPNSVIGQPNAAFDC